MQRGFAPIIILVGILLVVVAGIGAAWFTRKIQIPNFPPPGCYYEKIQCIQAPCNPILVCETQSSPQ